jgi:hypothetical protein
LIFDAPGKKLVGYLRDHKPLIACCSTFVACAPAIAHDSSLKIEAERARRAMSSKITVLQGVALAIAAVGALFGVAHTWIGRPRVRLKVIPKYLVPRGATDPTLTVCIELVNLSEFAVTVDDVGFLCRGAEHRFSIVRPVLGDGGEWPRRLEPSSSVTLYCETPAALGSLKCAYATTQCGRTMTGTSRAFKQIARGADRSATAHHGSATSSQTIRAS